jgi:CRP-like cAMP-binding protein
MITTSKEWEKFNHLFVREEIPAKTLLLAEGHIANTAYYIEKGCLRLWFNQEGKDVTFQFFFEGESVSSIESFITAAPSLLNLESLEPCIVLKISKNDLKFITENSQQIKSEIEAMLFKRLIFYQHLFLSRIKNKPEKRYKELIAQYPMLLERMPQHYIASYLGITSVSLSRIRNRR